MTVPAAFTASESFDAGTDLGSVVLRDYAERRPFKFGNSDDLRMSDPAEFYSKRVPEELYDTVRDPGCLRNLIHDAAHRQLRDDFRVRMEALLQRTNDQELDNYRQFLK